MKITKQQLKKIIKEEKSKLVLESQFDDDPVDRINTLAQTMFAAYNNIAAAADDAEEVLSISIITELDVMLDILEKISEKISSEGS